MTKVYKEAGGHKKLLVPVVALLLCAFAMVGAGYAFLASTASSSGNSLDGDVITVTIGTNEDADNWANASADFKISYGSYNLNGEEKFYVEGPQKIGTGTLKIDATTHNDGTKVTVAKAGNIDVIDESLEDAMSLSIEFTKANGTTLRVTDSQSEFEIDEFGFVTLEFEIYANFDNGELIGGTLPVAGESEREVYFINEATRAGLIVPIKYTVLFSVFPVDGSGSEFNTP
jgi:hypothetical protein